MKIHILSYNHLTQSIFSCFINHWNIQVFCEGLIMLTLPVHHPLIPTKQPPASPGSRCTTDSYTVGGICYWHGGGERESGVCFDAVKKLANLIVNEKNWTLSVADVKWQEVDFYCSSAVGFKMNSLGRRPEGAQQRSWRSWMIKQLLFTDTIYSRMADTLPLREGHPANTVSGCNSRQKLLTFDRN